MCVYTYVWEKSRRSHCRHLSAVGRTKHKTTLARNNTNCQMLSKTLKLESSSQSFELFESMSYLNERQKANSHPIRIYKHL